MKDVIRNLSQADVFRIVPNLQIELNLQHESNKQFSDTGQDQKIKVQCDIQSRDLSTSLSAPVLHVRVQS